MGSNPSRTPVEPFEVVDPLRNRRRAQQTTDSSPSPSPPPTKATLQWPLPPNPKSQPFKPNWPSDEQRYSVGRVYETKKKTLDIVFESTKTSTSRDFQQKETNTNEFNEVNSAICDSAQVQSSLSAKFESSINLSTNEEFDRIKKEVKSMRDKSDDFVQNEYKILSKEGQEIIDSIMDDTRRVQQDLLAYGKDRQKKQEDFYTEYLQKYVVELNRWKSKELANLQKEMDQYEKEVLQQSQKRISDANDEMNSLRQEISRTATEKVSVETKKITDKIQSKFAPLLGAESTTKIDLTIRGNVGNKLAGQ